MNKHNYRGVSGSPFKLGTGQRFSALKNKLAAKGATNPAALASFIGRKKLGKKRFQKLALQGRKRKA